LLEKLDIAKRPLNVHVIAAAQREVEVEPELWPREVVMIGPEVPVRAKVRTKRGPYERALWRELGRPDLIVAFHPGLLLYPTWKQTLLGLRGCGAPFAFTSYRSWEAEAESRLLTSLGAACSLGPEPNPAASSMPKRSSTIANDVSFDNAFIQAWQL
jgi:hypothetical protein